MSAHYYLSMSHKLDFTSFRFFIQVEFELSCCFIHFYRFFFGGPRKGSNHPLEPSQANPQESVGSWTSLSIYLDLAELSWVMFLTRTSLKLVVSVSYPLSLNPKRLLFYTHPLMMLTRSKITKTKTARRIHLKLITYSDPIWISRLEQISEKVN